MDVGQHVARGAVLIRIQAVDANLRLDEAQAAVARAEANLKLAESQNALAQTTAKRNAALLAGGLMPQTVADEARTQAETSSNSVLAARASLAQARAQLALAEKAVSDVVVVAALCRIHQRAPRRRSASSCSRRPPWSPCCGSIRSGCS